MQGVSPILWGDTIHSNIDRYVDRYFTKIFNRLGIKFEYNRQSKVLKACGGYIDFRSADNPENWEGFGYRVIILNEAGIILKNDYLWENAVQVMMLDYPDSIAIVGGTPKGKRTKKGKHKFYELYETALNDTTGRYFCKQISSYENPLLRKADIEQMRKDMPMIVAEQEIFGKFTDNTNALLDHNFIQRIRLLPNNLTYFIGVDLAISKKTTADYTAIAVVGIDKNRNIYVVDMIRFKASFHDILNKIQEVNEIYKPRRIMIEKVQFQAAVVTELARLTTLPVFPIRPDTDKITRFYSILAKYENGLIYHYSQMKNLSDFENELLSFPDGEHDDMVDALVYAIQEANKMIMI